MRFWPALRIPKHVQVTSQCRGLVFKLGARGGLYATGRWERRAVFVRLKIPKHSGSRFLSAACCPDRAGPFRPRWRFLFRWPARAVEAQEHKAATIRAPQTNSHVHTFAAKEISTSTKHQRSAKLKPVCPDPFLHRHHAASRVFLGEIRITCFRRPKPITLPENTVRPLPHTAATCQVAFL